MVDPGDYRGELLLVFENGKAARIPVAAYETKTNRRRLTGAYSDKSPLIAVLPLYEGSERIPRAVIVDMFSSDGTVDMELIVYNAAKGYAIDYETGVVTRVD